MNRLTLIALLAIAACSRDEPPQSTPPSQATEQPDSFGWGVHLRELCGKPYTTFSTDQGEYDCFRVDGEWHLRRTGDPR